MKSSIGSYSELIQLDSYLERLNYLRTFGDNPSNQDRFLMNKFYKSNQWLFVRERVIKRDLGCDLGITNLFIEEGPILVHHINPISIEDVANGSSFLFDLNNLITCSLATHNRIHYDKNSVTEWVERKPGDTKLW